MCRHDRAYYKTVSRPSVISKETYITASTWPSQSDMECVLHVVPQRWFDLQRPPRLEYLLAQAWQRRSLHRGSSQVTLMLRSFVDHGSTPSLARIRVQRRIAYIVSPPYPLPKHLLSPRLKRQFRPTSLAPSPSIRQENIHNMHPPLLCKTNPYLQPKPRIPLLIRPTPPKTQQK